MTTQNPASGAESSQRLNCPFCGHSNIGIISDEETDCRYVAVCQGCYAKTRTVLTKQEACIKWNARYESEKDVEIAELKKSLHEHVSSGNCNLKWLIEAQEKLVKAEAIIKETRSFQEYRWELKKAIEMYDLGGKMEGTK